MEQKNILTRTIEYNGKLFDKNNIMVLGYKFFSGQKLKCYWCKKQIIIAAYSSNENEGYFKTSQKENHKEDCNWKKSKSRSWDPKHPEKIAKRILDYMFRKKSVTREKRGPLHVGAQENKPSTARKHTNLKPGTKITIDEQSDYKYMGQIKHVAIYKNDLFISLFFDDVNANVRIRVFNGASRNVRQNTEYGLVCLFGTSTLTHSTRIPGIDIDVESKNFFYREKTK